MKKLSTIIILLMMLTYGARAQSVHCKSIVLLSSHTAYGSAGNIVVKNSGDTTSMLRFDLSTLPKGITVDSCRFRLVLAEPVLAGSYFTLNIINPVARINIQNIDKIHYDKNTSLEVHSIKLDTALSNRLSAEIKNLDIKLATSSRGGRLAFYSEDISQAEQPDDYSVIPRLIVYYTTKEPSPDWSGFAANSQHNSRIKANIIGSDIKDNVTAKTVFSAVSVSPVCFYHGRLYNIFRKSLAAYIGILDPVSQSCDSIRIDTTAQAGFAPAMDAFGKYYYMNSNMVNYFDPADYAVHTAMTFGAAEIPKANLTVGKDGSLYVVTDLFAYGYNRTFRKLWRYNYEGPDNARVHTDAVSPVSLSTDDSFAYIISITNGDIAHKKLTSLSTLTGKIRTQLNINFKNTEGSRQPRQAPVAVVQNNNNIFVTNGYPTGDTLYIFDKYLNLLKKYSFNNVSQPVVNNNGAVYFIANSNLYSIENGSTDITLCTKVDDNVNVTDIAIAGNYVYANSKDMAVGVNTVYIISTARKVVTKYVHPDKDDHNNLIVGADGSGYMTTSRDIIAYRNKQFETQGNVYASETATQPGIVYRAENLSFGQGVILNAHQTLIGATEVNFNNGVIVREDANIKVQSGGGFKFQPGFKVKAGALLTCKTGY